MVRIGAKKMADKKNSAEKTTSTLQGIVALVMIGITYAFLTSSLFSVIIPIILGITIFIADYNKKRLLKLAYFLIGAIFFVAIYITKLDKADLFKYHKQLFGLGNYENFFNNFIAVFYKHNALEALNIIITPAVSYGFISTALILLFCLIFIPKSASQKLAEANRKPKEAKISFKKLEKIGGGWQYGVPLGVDIWDKANPAILPFKILNKHTCLVGTTGSGKTVTLYNFIISALANDKALIFIDGKGTLENITKFSKFCKEVDRKYHIITIDGTDGYNPFASGTPSELTDKIISMFDWTEEHYKLTSSRFLQLLITYLRLKKIPVTLASIIKYSDMKKLVELELQNLHSTPVKKIMPSFEEPTEEPAVKNVMPSFGEPGEEPTVKNVMPSFEEPTEPIEQLTEPKQQETEEAAKASELYEKIKGMEPKAIQGLQARIASLAEGDMQEIFSNADALNLSEAIENKEAVLFSIDSLRYAEQSKALGRLVVNDIKTCVSHHARNGAKPVGLFFDEFNVFASHEVIDIINKSRSAGFEAVLAFQSLSDIDKLNNGEALRRQIIQNCNTLIVQKQNDSKDAEELSKIFGTYETQELTVQEEKTGEAGAGSLRMVNKFIVAPDDIKRLTTGEAFVKVGNIISKIAVRDTYTNF